MNISLFEAWARCICFQSTDWSSCTRLEEADLIVDGLEDGLPSFRLARRVGKKTEEEEEDTYEFEGMKCHLS